MVSFVYAFKDYLRDNSKAFNVKFLFVNYFIGIKLPVLVSDSDLENYPEFKKLLKTLTRYVSDDGTTMDVKKEYTEVWYKMTWIFKSIAAQWYFTVMHWSIEILTRGHMRKLWIIYFPISPHRRLWAFKIACAHTRMHGASRDAITCLLSAGCTKTLKNACVMCAILYKQNFHMHFANFPVWFLANHHISLGAGISID